jgi:hypothetical protein
MNFEFSSAPKWVVYIKIIESREGLLHAWTHRAHSPDVDDLIPPGQLALNFFLSFLQSRHIARHPDKA